ncbi:MAG: LamG domain-containing protein, partial [Gammaproteobacteria bacterium]
MSDSQPFKQFKTTQLARFSGYTLTRLLLLLALSVVISACGDDPAGNGTTDIDNNDGQNGNAVISTTIPLTKDIRSFKQEFYDPLADKCGTCHGAGQSPEFLAGDVNLAYSRAIPFVNLDVVNLDALGNSIFVTKVAGGHNCWDLDLAVCAADITQYITSWVTGSDGVSERDIVLVAPSIRDPGSNRTFPASALDGANSFASTVHVVLKNQCNSCHSETAATPQAPFFANDDPQTSYEAAKSKMNIDFTMDGQSVLADSPLLQSRFIVRLRSEFHNCWTNDCSDDAQDMQDQILLYAQGINIQPIDASLITSKAVNFDDAIIASGGKRHESHTIALWEFAEGSGGIAYDSSGVPDPVNMNLSNTQWLTGNGIEILLGGYAQAYTDDSKKLYNFIKASGEYTLEAWVIPANVTQEESSIISYTGGGSYRNFTMGQTMYNYDFVNLSTDAIGDVVTDGTQDDKLMTNPDDEDLQSSLQHVVMTYAPGVGRKVFVNGQDTGDVDDAGISSGLLNDWSTDFGLYFGREPGNANTQWLGKIRLVAIHNRALTIDQVQQNYEVGVGQRYFLLFSVAERLGAGYEGSFILFEVEQYDNDGY